MPDLFPGQMMLRCHRGHEYPLTREEALQGKGCPVCAVRFLNTLEDAQQAAARRGGKCISTQFVPSPMCMEWQCANRHRFLASYDIVKRGAWCIQCQTSSNRYN